jgi:hypothetical protein
MRYSKGIMWLDDCRIPFVDEVRTIPVHSDDKKTDDTLFRLHPTIQHKREITTQGRFTPNLLVCDDMLNDGSVSKSQRGRNDVGKPTYTGNSLLNSKTTMNNTDRGFDDKGSSSRYYDLDKWFDKVIDEIQ